ncbi:uncharacterized protein [Littorina saxatilis]|uniref:uncharacterized protein n=1 Tax=Littorina saxatilis TaxID=31220 RepID=UPI0038B5BD80
MYQSVKKLSTISLKGRTDLWWTYKELTFKLSNPVFFLQPETSDSGTNIGLIVGPLVAILLIGALAGVVGNVLWQRKRKLTVAPEEEEEGAGKEPSNVVDEKKEEPKPQPPAQENQEATPVPATTVDL